MELLSRKEQKEKTRLGLVRSAEVLFAKHGISRTTTADVAKTLRVSHGTVFVHFPTRDDLILAVVEASKDGDPLGDGLLHRPELDPQAPGDVVVIGDLVVRAVSGCIS